MKFGNLLKSAGEHDPKLLEIFKFYKRLKKDLKAYGPGDAAVSEATSLDDEQAAAEAGPSTGDNPSTEAFVTTLLENVAELREQCMEREENAVIKLEQLQKHTDKALSSGNTAQQQEVYHHLLNLHGELLLLLHWGMMAYTATSKILKKREKQTGEHIAAQDAVFGNPVCAMDVRVCTLLLCAVCGPLRNLSMTDGDRHDPQGRRHAGIPLCVARPCTPRPRLANTQHTSQHPRAVQGPHHAVGGHGRRGRCGQRCRQPGQRHSWAQAAEGGA